MGDDLGECGSTGTLMGDLFGDHVGDQTGEWSRPTELMESFLVPDMDFAA